jgi:ribosomal protein S18 acetylase RimI-like enzyme
MCDSRLMSAPGLRLDPPTFADTPAVFAMLVARDVADFGVPDITLADLEDEWSSDSLDLAADAVLARTASGALVGYAVIHRPGAIGFVAPDHEGRGVGAALVAWARQRERRLGRSHHRQAIPASNVRARELMLAAGYEYERSFSRMLRALDGSEREPGLPGLTVRPVEPEADARALHALNELSFAGNPEFQPETLAQFSDEHLRPRDVAPELSLIVHDGDTMVGFLLARRWSEEATGFIDLLAVHANWRRRGIGSGLLATAFARFAADGLGEAQLEVASDNPRALQIYERAGMRPRFVIDSYVRALDAGPAGG